MVRDYIQMMQVLFFENQKESIRLYSFSNCYVLQYLHLEVLVLVPVLFSVMAVLLFNLF